MIGSGRHEFWKEFIELVEKLPETWHPKYAEDREKRQASFNVLGKKLREIRKTGDGDLAMRKLNSLKVSYKKELKRFKEFQKKGKRNRCSKYKQCFPYFEQMHFLRDIVDSSDESGDVKEMNSSSEVELVEPKRENDDEVVIADDEVESVECCNSKTAQGSQPIIVENSNEDAKIVKQEPSNSAQDDEYILIVGQVWTAEFRKLNEDQRLHAKHAIDEVLYRGRLGLLGKPMSQIHIQTFSNNHSLFNAQAKSNIKNK